MVGFIWAEMDVQEYDRVRAVKGWKPARREMNDDMSQDGTVVAVFVPEGVIKVREHPRSVRGAERR